MGAGIVGAIAPKRCVTLYVALVIWLHRLLRGSAAGAGTHHDSVVPFPVPDLRFRASVFRTWLLLDKWIPQMFVASGDCSVRQWEFLTLEMPQWLVDLRRLSDRGAAGADCPAFQTEKTRSSAAVRGSKTLLQGRFCLLVDDATLQRCILNYIFKHPLRSRRCSHLRIPAHWKVKRSTPFFTKQNVLAALLQPPQYHCRRRFGQLCVMEGTNHRLWLCWRTGKRTGSRKW